MCFNVCVCVCVCECEFGPKEAWDLSSHAEEKSVPPEKQKGQLICRITWQLGGER